MFVIWKKGGRANWGEESGGKCTEAENSTCITNSYKQFLNYWLIELFLTFLHVFPRPSQFLELDFMPNPPRGCSYLYGHGAVEPFLKENNLVGIIRAHQCKEEGVGYTYTDNRIIDYKFPYITTVFSASNYCGTHGNKAAVMVFHKDSIQVSTSSAGLEMYGNFKGSK